MLSSSIKHPCYQVNCPINTSKVNSKYSESLKTQHKWCNCKENWTYTCIMSFSPLHCKYSLINNPIAVTRLMMIAFAGFVLKSPANLLFTASSQGYNRRFGTAIKILMRKRFCIYINSSYVTCISCRTFYFLINPPDTLKQCSDFLHLIAINC